MGPLQGVTVIEIAGIGPGPYCGMLLSDLGADVIRVDRQKPGMFGGWGNVQFDVHGRGRRSIALDLKRPAGVEIVLRLVDRADALIEGFRPGVAERLGIGPDRCFERNPKLVYGRMTGWGQQGPLADAAGHDVNYISLTGALHAIGRDGEPPTIPLNVIGDFGGGAMFLALGVVAGLFESARSGKGQQGVGLPVEAEGEERAVRPVGPGGVFADRKVGDRAEEGLLACDSGRRDRRVLGQRP